MSQWQPIETAPRVNGYRIQVEVQGKLRAAAWGKTSHLPWVGWCLADQGAENFDYIHPQPTRYLPAPPLSVTKYVPTAPYDGTRQEDQG